MSGHPNGTLVLPDGREVGRPGWSPSAEILAEREALMRRSYYLVRIGGNDGLGEAWRCKRCRGRHKYLTKNCTELPYNGLDQASYAIYHLAGDLAAVRSLDPRQRVRQTAKQTILRPVMDLPDLATMHPQMARQIAHQQRLQTFEVEMCGVAVGRIEQIPRSLAQRLLDKVNRDLPIDARITVEGLTT